jgi:hypothetical protein
VVSVEGEVNYKEAWILVPDGLCGFEINNARTLMPAASASRSRRA